jgi:hypothetical protein
MKNGRFALLCSLEIECLKRRCSLAGRIRMKNGRFALTDSLREFCVNQLSIVMHSYHLLATDAPVTG